MDGTGESMQMKFIGHVYGVHWPCFPTGARLKVISLLKTAGIDPETGWDWSRSVPSNKEHGAYEGHSTKWGPFVFPRWKTVPH